MNRQDFQRNFQWSYFGLVAAPKLLAQLASNGITPREGYDLTPGLIIPAYQPAINSSETSMVVYVVLKLTEPDTYVRKRLTLPWKPDCDEDGEYMLSGVPSVGMIQGRYSAIYVSRVPARDTPRGFSPKYSRVASVNHALMRSEGLVNYDDDSLVWRVYNKVFYTWAESISQIDEGQILGAAVDKFLAVGVTIGRPHTQIFYKGSGAVGYVDNGTPYVYPDSSTYSLREYIRKIAGIMPEVRQP
jgi:hypothetical protein